MMIEQVLWLSLCVYFEARGEPPLGQEGVVHVILNRAEQQNKSVIEIIQAPHQFSWVHDDIPDHIKDFKAYSRCIQSVYDTFRKRLDGETMEGSNHYFNFHIANPPWASNMETVTVIGNHIFLKG